jgi:hypothetical protein
MRRINPEAPLTSSQKNKRYYDNHRELVLAKNAKYHRDNKEEVAKRHRLVAFKMSEEQHDQKLKEQENKCAVCKKIFVMTPHIDHSHGCCPKKPTCGQCTRGLLCNHCNVLIGMCFESIEILGNAIQYLKEYQNASTSQS